MKTEVKKRLGTCLLLWTAFVALKWIMLLSPSSIFCKLAPLSVLLQDGDNDYAVSGWVSIGIETAMIGVFLLIRSKKINLLYLLCMIYSALYVPSVVFWIVTLEFEVWRYMQFLPVICCCGMMFAGCFEYIKQEKLVRPKGRPVKKSVEPDAEKENKNGSSDE